MRTGQWSANHPLFHHKTFSLVTYLFKQLDILREPNPIQHSLDTFVQMRQLDEMDHQAIGNVKFGEFLGIVCRVCQEFATLREREADVSAFERLLELLLKRTHVVITRKDALQFIQKRFHTCYRLCVQFDRPRDPLHPPVPSFRVTPSHVELWSNSSLRTSHLSRY